jgi:plasmid stabilization system protein ParE
MRKLVYSAEAISNLKKIYDHTKENFSKDTARSVIRNIFLKISTLEKFPQVGKTSALSELVKEFIVEGNTIYYQVTEDTIDIVFIKPRRTKK